MSSPSVHSIYEDLCRKPSDINEHLPTLRMLASDCSSVVEMGVRSVVSTWAFAEAKPDKLISIDIENPSKFGQDIEFVKSVILKEDIDFSFILADTREYEIEETDFLFIDTWHVYDQLKIELKKHGNKARKYLAFHDTVTFGERGESPGHRGLMPAIEEFLEANPHWQVKHHYTNNNGLLVLERIST